MTPKYWLKEKEQATQKKENHVQYYSRNGSTPSFFHKCNTIPINLVFRISAVPAVKTSVGAVAKNTQNCFAGECVAYLWSRCIIMTKKNGVAPSRELLYTLIKPLNSYSFLLFMGYPGFCHTHINSTIVAIMAKDIVSQSLHIYLPTPNLSAQLSTPTHACVYYTLCSV